MYVRNASEAQEFVDTGIAILETFPMEYIHKEYERKWYYRMKGSFYNLRGLINKRFSKFKEAEEDFKKAIHFFDEIGNKKISNNLKNNLIHIYLTLGKIKQCEEMVNTLIQEKGPWSRVSYLQAALLELVYKENLKKAEENIEEYLKFSQKYELLDGYYYYYSLKFTIEGIYKNNIERAKKILNDFEIFLRKNNINFWESSFYVNKIEFSFINRNLDEVNDYLRILSVKKLHEDNKKFFDFYSALYAYLMRYDKEKIFRYIEELEQKGDVLHLLYFLRFLTRLFADLRDENAENVRRIYLELREKYVSSV